MSKRRCTLGPWNMVQWGDGSGADTYIVTSDPAEAVIASGLLRAEAALIASAPDLLLCLKEVLEIAERNEVGGFVHRARSAIARAEDSRPHGRSVR